MPSKSPTQEAPQSAAKESSDTGTKSAAMKPTRGSYSKPAWEHKVKGR